MFVLVRTIVCAPNYGRRYHPAARNAEAIDTVNTGLAQIFGSGQIVEIFKKWFSQVGLRPDPLMLSVFTLGALPNDNPR